MPYTVTIIFYSESHNRYTNKVTNELQKLKLNAPVNWRYMLNQRIASVGNE